MIQIRQGVFETNSSSTHSICIQKKPVSADYSHIVFNIGEFGWEEREVNFGDYLYTAIVCLKSKKCLNKLKEILDKHHITYEFEAPVYDNSYGYDYLINGYIDHDTETYEFVHTVLDDEDMLLRGLFGGNSAVYTGNDNVEHDDDCMCTIAQEYRYCKDADENWGYKKVGNWDNPYYDPDNFDYFYKGN